MWAYEYEAGKFIAGEILGDTLYMYAPTGRGEKWVMNSEGVVLEYSSEPFHKSDEIIAGINAHYGTSFYQEDDIDKDFTIGETMPNWNAYEKIEMPETKQYLAINYDGYAAGYLENENVNLYGYTSTGNIIICSEEGFVYQGGEVLSEEVRMILNSKLQNAGIQFNEIIVVESPYAYGETIENWDNYQKIS